MRNFLAVILAIVAGLTASLGLIAWKLNGVTHQPEPVQDILGSGEAADQLKAAVPDALGNMASESIDVLCLTRRSIQRCHRLHNTSPLRMTLMRLGPKAWNKHVPDGSIRLIHYKKKWMPVN